VCWCVLRRAAGEHVNLWAGFLGQTAACRLGKHQNKWLCSDVDSSATAGRQGHCKSASPCRNTERERRLVRLRGRNACGEHGTNFGPGQREEFEPPCSIFRAVYRRWCPQISIFGPAKHKSLDSARFLIPPREPAM